MTLTSVIATALVVLLSVYVYKSVLEAGFDMFPARYDPSGAVMSAALYKTTGEAEVLKFVNDFPKPKPLPHQVSLNQRNLTVK